MLVESRIPKNKKSHRDETLFLSVNSDYEIFYEAIVLFYFCCREKPWSKFEKLDWYRKKQ